MAQQRSRGRPTTAVLTSEKIAAAAMRIISVSGYDKLTMTGVAHHLGVAPSALYNHVAGKDELLYLVEDAVMKQVDITALEQALRGELTVTAALTQWARSYRDVTARHSPLIAHLATMPIFGTRETVRMYELVVQVLLRAAVSPAAVMDIVVALESFIFGSAYDVAAPASIFHLPDELSEVPGLRTVLAARHRPEHPAAALNNPYADPPFEIGLAALIRGLIPPEPAPAAEQATP